MIELNVFKANKDREDEDWAREKIKSIATKSEPLIIEQNDSDDMYDCVFADDCSYKKSNSSIKKVGKDKRSFYEYVGD